MRKAQELMDPKSCMSRAHIDEMTFVLLGRDVTAPDTIRHWVALRLGCGKNTITDPQIVEALECADKMEMERRLALSEGAASVTTGRWEVNENP